MLSLGTQAISLRLQPRVVMFNKRKNLENKFLVMQATFLESNLRTFSVRPMVKLVSNHPVIPSSAESINKLELNLPPCLRTLTSTTQRLPINLKALPKLLEFNAERICTKR